jgi:hypothetical protein
LRQFQPLFPVTDEKDAFGPQTFGGEDATESDSSIANHGHRAACPNPCGDGSMMTCRHDISKKEDGLEQMLVAFTCVIRATTSVGVSMLLFLFSTLCPFCPFCTFWNGSASSHSASEMR